MATKFYKKFSPDLGVNIGGTQVVKFPTLDGIIGYYATQDANLQNAFAAQINAGKFGLSEITWAEYEANWVKKKAMASPLKRPWRDELSNQGSRIASTINPDQKDAVAVVSSNGNGHQDCGRMATMVDGEPSAEAVKAVAAVAEALKVPFAPPVGKREPRI